MIGALLLLFTLYFATFSISRKAEVGGMIFVKKICNDENYLFVFMIFS
jgi:hypothetical protein